MQIPDATLDPFYILTPVLTIFMLIILMVVMIYFYMKMRIFPVILIVYLFSIIIGINSMTTGDIPFTPYFQTFFLLLQSVFFLLTAQAVFKKR